MNARLLRTVKVMLFVLLLLSSGGLGLSRATTAARWERAQAVGVCTMWNLASDFLTSPDQANPNPDSCGNEGVWHFFSADLNRQTYTPLPYYTPGTYGITGIERWRKTSIDVPEEDLPVVGSNATGAQVYYPMVVPPNAAFAHVIDRASIYQA